MLQFRERLSVRETVGDIARQVFDRYGFDDVYADALVAVLCTFDSTTRTCGDIVRFVERSLEADATHEVDDSHVLFSAGPSPSPLFENLPLEPTEVDPDVEASRSQATEQARLQVSVPVPDTPTGQTPHSLMDDSVFSEVEGGRGVEFGTRVHDFAEQYAEGEPVEPSNADERTVATFLDSLPGELVPEENASLPIEVGSDRVTISGIVDLLHVTDERVDIVDYKTDRGRHAESEYRKQLSVYSHVVRETYPDRRVTASILYTVDGNRVEVDPLSKGEIAELIETNPAENRSEADENYPFR